MITVSLMDLLAAKSSLTMQFIEDNIDAWLVCVVDILAWAAELQLQAAYAAITKSLQFECSFVQ